jgi:hypothetical protein
MALDRSLVAPPASAQISLPSQGTMDVDDHQAEIRRMKRLQVADLEAADDRRLKEVRASERKWESRFEAREVEW